MVEELMQSIFFICFSNKLMLLSSFHLLTFLVPYEEMLKFSNAAVNSHYCHHMYVFAWQLPVSPFTILVNSEWNNKIIFPPWRFAFVILHFQTSLSVQLYDIPYEVFSRISCILYYSYCVNWYTGLALYHRLPLR